MNTLFGYTALSGFLLALAAHIATICGVDVSARVPAVWGLHAGIFIVFIPMVFSMRKTIGTKPTFAEIRAAFPPWVVVFGICLFAYVLLNFVFMFILGSVGGNPSMVGGKYILENHGKLIREITEAEYREAMANTIRGFSGHWLIFYFAPFAYFILRNEPLNSMASDGQEKLP